MAATMKDVAARAGVSVITVSRVVNGTGYVNAETRARVHAAIEELQFVPNRMASSLRARRTKTLALLLPTIANTFWTTIARGVEDEGEAHGYSVFLCNTDDEPAKEARYIEVLLGRRVDGIAIVPSATSDAQMTRAQQRRMPLVQLHRRLPGVAADSVRADNGGGTAALTTRLLAAGHRRVAYVGGSPTISPTRDCISGYETALQRAGVAIEPALVRLGRLAPQTGYDLTADLLRAAPIPDAICIGNSRLAIGALRAIEEAGLRVPDDLEVAAFYDIAALDCYSTHLITAAQPAYDIGRLGTRRLLERIAGLQDPPEDLVLPVPIRDRRNAPDDARRDLIAAG